jgi:hypothetical protein
VVRIPAATLLTAPKIAPMRRHFRIVAEELRHELRVVAEGVGSLGDRIERLEAQVVKVTDTLDTRVTRLEAASPRTSRCTIPKCAATKGRQPHRRTPGAAERGHASHLFHSHEHHDGLE